MGKRGPQKGAKYAKTREKEAMRAALRRLVDREMEEMTAAQIAAAKGIKYLMARNKKGGTFRPVKDVMAAIQSDEEIIEVWEKPPSTQAYSDLMNRAMDKPVEQQQVDLTVNAGEKVLEALQAGRERVAKGK